MTTQAATTLTFGSYIIVPDVLNNVRLHPASKVYISARIPTLNAGVMTVSSSDDAGATYFNVLGALALTGYEPALPTAATYTGGQRLIFGPFVPGTWLKITSGAAQTATVNCRFMF